jgi:DNA-binding response OmpR family regulator
LNYKSCKILQMWLAITLRSRGIADTEQRKKKLYPEGPAAAAEMATVLVVNRDIATRKRLIELLMAGGYDVWAVAAGVAEIDGLGPDLPSAVLLSLQSDATSAQNLCMAIRQSATAVPVTVLGPDIDVQTKVTLFELGADDYMVQPFDSLEMLARLRAVIRRSRWMSGGLDQACIVPGSQ